jgi:hypothetical protein
VLLVLALSAALAIGAPLGADYDNAGCRVSPACDDPGPAIDALAHGRVGRFFDEQPIAGPVSVVLRAPLVRVADEFGAAVLDRYRVGALACLLALSAVALWLTAVARARGAPWQLQLVLLAGTILNPLTSKVLFWGHPEDFLAAGLVVAGVTLAGTGSAVAAGVVLGLAASTKLWAGLALLVALGALPNGRVRLTVAFGAVAAVLLGTMFVADPSAFTDRLGAVGRFGSEPGTLTPSGAWYAFGHDVSYLAGALRGGHVVLVPATGRVIDPWLAHAARALILAVAAGVVLFWVRRTPAAARRTTALTAASLVFLLRATLEPGNYSYYLLPAFLALLAWEVVDRRRLPVATVVSGFCIWALGPIAAHTSDAGFNVVYLLLAAALTAYLAGVVGGSRRESA